MSKYLNLFYIFGFILIFMSVLPSLSGQHSEFKCKDDRYCGKFACKLSLLLSLEIIILILNRFFILVCDLKVGLCHNYANAGKKNPNENLPPVYTGKNNTITIVDNLSRAKISRLVSTFLRYR